METLFTKDDFDTENIGCEASGGGRKRKSRKRRKRKTKRRRRRGGVKTPTKKSSPTKKRTPNNVSITVQELESIKEDTDEKAFRKLFQTTFQRSKPDKLLKTPSVRRKNLPPHYWTRDGHNNPIKYLNTRKGGRKRRRRRTKKRRRRRR